MSMEQPPVSVHICKLLQKSETTGADSKCFIYLQSKWLENSAEILLQETKGGRCYKGKLTNEVFEESAGELEIPYADFFEECRQALTTKELALPGFEYEIDEDEKLFKLIKKQEFPIQYLWVPLREVPNNYDMLDTAFSLINDQQQSRMGKIQETEKNIQNFQTLQLALDCCLKEKQNLEKKLLKKFVLLLNSKKEKILELEEKLAELQEANANGNGSVESDAEAEGEEEGTAAGADSATRNVRKPLISGKRNKKDAAADSADEDDDLDFEASTQLLTQFVPSTGNVMPKRNRRISDDDE